jgi:hypothetical protein
VREGCLMCLNFRHSEEFLKAHKWLFKQRRQHGLKYHLCYPSAFLERGHIPLYSVGSTVAQRRQVAGAGVGQTLSSRGPVQRLASSEPWQPVCQSVMILLVKWWVLVTDGVSQRWKSGWLSEESVKKLHLLLKSIPPTYFK